MGFFGVVLKPGEKEPVEIPHGWRLQLCSALLEPSKSEGKDPKGTVWVEVAEEDENDEVRMGNYMLVRLQGTGSLSQMALSHSFNSVDETIYFEARGGSSKIHLTGYFTRESLEDANFGSGEESDEDEDEEEEEEEDEDKAAGDQPGLNGRAPRAAAAAAARSMAKEEAKGRRNAEEDEDDEDDGEYVAGEGDEDDEDDDDEEEEEKKGAEQGGKRGVIGVADGSDSGRPPSKKSRQGDGPVSKGDGGKEASTEAGSGTSKRAQKLARQKENKKKAAEAKRAMNEAFAEDQKEEPPVDVELKKPVTKKRKGGLKVTDIVVGGGAEVQQGQGVQILYTGSLPNGKIFDKNKNRKKPLKFRVGMKNVIAGMDKGMLGMRVGGIRKLEIPSALGYGKEATGPIPANQDLVFEVELLGVSANK